MEGFQLGVGTADRGLGCSTCAGMELSPSTRGAKGVTGLYAELQSFRVSQTPGVTTGSGSISKAVRYTARFNDLDSREGNAGDAFERYLLSFI